MYLTIDAATVKGSRERNQDIFLVNSFVSSPDITDPQQYRCTVSNEMINVFAVCDGVGQFDDSGEAAKKALEAIRTVTEMEKDNFPFETDTIDKDETTLHPSPDSSQEIDSLLLNFAEKALVSAKKEVVKFGKEHDTYATTTLTMLITYKSRYLIVNVGDSPAFMIMDDDIMELTFRHNLANYKKLNGITEEREPWNLKSITKKIFGGITRVIFPDAYKAEDPKRDERHLLNYITRNPFSNEVIYSCRGGDITDFLCCLLCTDGLTECLSDETLSSLISEGHSSREIVEIASMTGLTDNITAITVKGGTYAR